MYPNANLLISTIGPDVGDDTWKDLMVTAYHIPRVGLQFSVHEAIEEKRNALIPFKKKLSLSQISERGAQFYIITGRKPYFNYCVSDSNNSQEEADLLSKYFPPNIWECTLSVICERDESIAKANDRQRSLVEVFMEKLLTMGHSVRMFDPAGQDDIGGGCGQLFHVQNWVKENPQYAKRTAGTGLPKVHMPVELT